MNGPRIPSQRMPCVAADERGRDLYDWAMDKDRLGWIFDGGDRASLEAKYDAWAATYDADHDEWGWVGPERVAEAALRLGGLSANATIYDAGCGTGKAGIALRRAGFTGRVVGLDLSGGMLKVATQTGAYDSLVKCSLVDVPFDGDTAHAIVASGVFTHGHVGGEAFAELCRITRSGGLIAITQRVDLEEALQPHADALTRDGLWAVTERTAATNLHPDRDHVDQIIMSWRVA